MKTISFCTNLSRKKTVQLVTYFLGVGIILLSHLGLLAKPGILKTKRAVCMHAIIILIALALIVFSVLS